MSSWKTQGAHAAPEPPDENGVQTGFASTGEGTPSRSPSGGVEVNHPPGLGGPPKAQGAADPRAPGASPGLTVLHHAGARAPWPGTLHLGASRELGGLPGAGCRPTATCMLRAGLISDNRRGRRTGVLGSVPKSANEGGRLRSLRWGGLGARGPLPAGTLSRVLSCLPAWPGRAATRWTVGEGLDCPSARLRPPEQNYLANIPGLPDS